MFYLVETKLQLKRLLKNSYGKAFVEVIPYSYKDHPFKSNICAFYIRPLNLTKGFIIPISHGETLELPIECINGVLDKFKTLYVRDKKEFLHHYIDHKNVFDITINSPTYIQELTQTHQWFHQKHPNKSDVNRIIPIVKHYEYCENIFNKLKPHINEPVNEFYNKKATMVFNAVERSGIRIDRQQFKSHFYDFSGDYVHTQFNFKTLTRRPSNKFKGVNYAALNKENGERKSFIPRNDIFVELDISAYHPTLLANLIGYEFDSNDVHESFAKMYGTTYKKSKEITFKQLYGGIFSEYKEIEFFKRAQKYIDELWSKFQNEGFIEVPISKWKFEKDKLDDMKPQKLLNYLLQGLETAMNVCILWDIIKLLRGKNTKVVLYTYDSFLLDLDKTEKDIFKEIQKVFKKYKLQTKISYGDNYDFR